jgi:hypothetical protein
MFYVADSNFDGLDKKGRRKMKKVLILILVAALVLTVSSAFATVRVNDGSLIAPPTPHRGPFGTLDDQCTIDFIGFTNGGPYTGNMYWPGGGGGQYRMCGFIFTNSCTPGVLLYVYCTDMDHELMQDPYCVNIDPRPVNPLYPEQMPAMAYAMTWYPVLNGFDDMVMQLAIWKLSSEERVGDPNFGLPFYRFGYPPYHLNTLYNNDPSVNDPANQRDSLALGMVDGIPRNVYMCGDQLNASAGGAIINGGTVTVPITINLTRGALAQQLLNTSLSGVRIEVSTDYGTLSATDVLTDASGNAYLNITAPIYSGTDAHVQICTKGSWPKLVVPCDGVGYQQLLVQQLTGDQLCEQCISLRIPGDTWEPAELASFTAVSSTNGIELAWRTASETNLSRWDVERSTSGSYHTIAQMTAANVASGHAYRYVDTDVQHCITYSYRLVDVDFGGTRTTHNMVVQASWTTTASNVPAAYELYANYPNPFNPETRIRFALPEAGTVSLKVYDVTGHEVATLASGELSADEHSVTFRANNLPSGLYFYTLKAGVFTQTRKMILMK